MRVSTRRLIKALAFEVEWRDDKAVARALLFFRRKLSRAWSMKGSKEYEAFEADMDDAIKELSR